MRIKRIAQKQSFCAQKYDKNSDYTSLECFFTINFINKSINRNDDTPMFRTKIYR